MRNRFEIDVTELQDSRDKQVPDELDDVRLPTPERRLRDVIDEMADRLDAQEEYLFNIMGR